MCGRYSYFGPLDILKESITFTLFNREPTANYNVSPTHSVPALLSIDDQIALKHLHWGLIPFWAKDTSMASKMINARMETLSEKPSFKNAFKKRRCLLLSNGYYEWTGPKGAKQPYFITTHSDRPFAFAGLWETWRDKQKPEAPRIDSCTIITTQAADDIDHLHHRMPVVLNPELYETWLNPKTENPTECHRILTEGMIRDFHYYPVSTAVNNVRNNDLSLIKPITVNDLKTPIR